MARPKTPEDVELARIQASLERARIICSTVRLCVLGAMGTVCVGIIAWAAVRIADKPAWLEFALAVLGSIGATSTVTWRLWVRLRRRNAAADVEAGPTDRAEPPGGGGESS